MVLRSLQTDGYSREFTRLANDTERNWGAMQLANVVMVARSSRRTGMVKIRTARSDSRRARQRAASRQVGGEQKGYGAARRSCRCETRTGFPKWRNLGLAFSGHSFAMSPECRRTGARRQATITVVRWREDGQGRVGESPH